MHSRAEADVDRGEEQELTRLEAMVMAGWTWMMGTSTRITRHHQPCLDHAPHMREDARHCRPPTADLLPPTSYRRPPTDPLPPYPRDAYT